MASFYPPRQQSIVTMTLRRSNCDNVSDLFPIEKLTNVSISLRCSRFSHSPRSSGDNCCRMSAVSSAWSLSSCHHCQCCPRGVENQRGQEPDDDTAGDNHNKLNE